MLGIISCMHARYSLYFTLSSIVSSIRFSSIVFGNRIQRIVDLVLKSKLDMQSGLLEVEYEILSCFAIYLEVVQIVYSTNNHISIF
jgi:hypothetical protein